jgi:DNA excision repair protein ERCC-3
VHGLVLVTTERAAEEGRPVEEGDAADRRPGRPDTVVVHPSERGHLKQVLLKLAGRPRLRRAYVDGEAHRSTLVQDGWRCGRYQREAVEGFWHGGSGVVVLPCGAGKTIVGAARWPRRRRPR